MTTDLLRDGADPLPLKATHAHELDDLLAPKVAMLTRALARASQAEARTQFGFSQTEWQVVTLLASSQPASIRKLAGFAMVDAAQISRAVVSLSRQGLVERRTSERDNRQAALRLSPPGMDIAVSLRQLSRQRNTRLLGGFSAEQVRELFDMMDVLIARAIREEVDGAREG